MTMMNTKMMIMMNTMIDSVDDDISGSPRRLKKQLKMWKHWQRQSNIMPLIFQGDKMMNTMIIMMIHQNNNKALKLVPFICFPVSVKI